LQYPVGTLSFNYVAGITAKIKTLTIKEVAMLISQAFTIFMDYQKMNSGKKYGQKLRAFSQQI